MPQFFIDRPVFAWVVAILIALGGLLALMRLPAEAYPEIAPPQVAVSTTYPGASAATVETTVTQVIEQQLTGLDNLLYFTSQSASDGSAAIVLTFATGTNADIAAVQTQNRVTLAQPRLPAEVNQQGIRIAKVSAGFLGAIGLRSAAGGPGAEELNNLVASRILDQVQRIPGVGTAVQFGSEYAMRIWLDADRLRAYSLSASSVLSAVRSQNAQFASGAIGAQPAVGDQAMTATVTAEGRFRTPEQFENILLRTEPNGASVRLRDVARVTLGAAQYGFETRIGATPVAAFGIQLAPNANALDVAKAVEARMNNIAPSFPAGVSWFWAFDSTTFIKVAIREVIVTLTEAVALVFLVMLVFLQSFRATLIPTLVVPSALLGTLVGMYAVGFSINQLSLFAMVLAIGIVVDDAIVVVEAVERIMREEQLPPKEATRKAMQQITGAIAASTERPADRQHRGDLPAVRAHHRALHGLLGAAGAVVHPGAVRIAPASRAPARQRRVRLVQPRLRGLAERLRAPRIRLGGPRAALDGGLRRDPAGGGAAVPPAPGQLPAGRGPGLHAGRRAAARGRLAPAHPRGAAAYQRHPDGESGRLAGVPHRRLELHRHRRERRPCVHQTQALGRAPGQGRGFHPLGE